MVHLAFRCALTTHFVFIINIYEEKGGGQNCSNYFSLHKFFPSSASSHQTCSEHSHIFHCVCGSQQLLLFLIIKQNYSTDETDASNRGISSCILSWKGRRLPFLNAALPQLQLSDGLDDWRKMDWKIWVDVRICRIKKFICPKSVVGLAQRLTLTGTTLNWPLQFAVGFNYFGLMYKCRINKYICPKSVVRIAPEVNSYRHHSKLTLVFAVGAYYSWSLIFLQPIVMHWWFTKSLPALKLECKALFSIHWNSYQCFIPKMGKLQCFWGRVSPFEA